MKKAILIIRSISLLSLLISIGFIMNAPNIVALHITADNVVDSSGSKCILLLESTLLIIINEINIFNIKRYRQSQALSEMPIILIKEWYLISIAIILLIIFSFVMYQQITWR
ncbi:hypothetical protein [Latilactobacillus graminis]|uniref:DUF1648 domain-containing protein n=1 Tax=Latilactobacillus graminis TaxID=60519 RepID=A0ABX6C6P0_9LACO|nr:hypothetical protein [Latilactobacillus graminis]QFP79279.1 hypothetical protein LG542_03130 [Latilactobacillus graminis]